MNILITGVAGFIGYHVAKKLTGIGFDVDGIDHLQNENSNKLKKLRLNNLNSQKNFRFYNSDVKNINSLKLKNKYRCVIHLAAKAGVRQSQAKSSEYLINNIIGHNSVLNFSLENSERMVYASSSSVYGEHKNDFSTESDHTDNPTSIYGISKKTCEMISENCFLNSSFPQIGLRFFTVYGEYGRPDMAYWIFTKNIIENKEITLFNNGEMLRDFTYIDDIVDGIIRCIELDNFDKHSVLNLGRSEVRKTSEMVGIIENLLNKKAIIASMPKLPIDVSLTSSSNIRANNLLGYNPKISLEFGLEKFVKWYVRFKKEI